MTSYKHGKNQLLWCVPVIVITFTVIIISVKFYKWIHNVISNKITIKLMNNKLIMTHFNTNNYRQSNQVYPKYLVRVCFTGGLPLIFCIMTIYPKVIGFQKHLSSFKDPV